MDSNNISINYTDEEKQLLIQENIATLLEELSYRYTHGRSFSIKTENAQMIIRSVMFAVSLSGEMDIFDHASFKLAYQAGLVRIDTLLSECRELYKAVLDTRVKTGLKSYTEMLDIGIPAFFNSYDKTFAATEIPAEIDYPVFRCNQMLDGALYIKDYLQCVLNENKICGFFDTLDIEMLLSAFGDNEGQVYTLLQPNIFEIVITNSIFSIIIGNNPNNINLESVHKNIIEQRLKGITPKQAMALLDESADIFLKYFQIENNVNLTTYILSYCKSVLKLRFKAAAENGVLSNIPIIYSGGARQEFTLDTGRKMPNRLFRALIAKIEGEAEINEKMKLIRENVSSLTDFTDIFKANIFYGNEINEIFSMLTEDEQKILSSTVFYDYKDMGNFKDFIKTVKSDVAWEQQYIDFLNSRNH